LIGVESGAFLWTANWTRVGTTPGVKDASKTLREAARGVISAFPKKKGGELPQVGAQVPPLAVEEARKPEPPLVEEPAKPDPSRSRWLNETYDQTISHVRGTQWVERSNKTQKITSHLTETERTPDYVELANFNFGVGRLFPQRMVMKKGDKWEWVATGHWDNNVGIPAGESDPPARDKGSTAKPSGDSNAGDPFKK
jgi:hypothetical protein